MTHHPHLGLTRTVGPSQRGADGALLPVVRHLPNLSVADRCAVEAEARRFELAHQPPRSQTMPQPPLTPPDPEGLRDALDRLPDRPPVRRATVTSKGSTLAAVQAYLPANYTAEQHDPLGPITIAGHDNAGWTLDGYVLPRLASGMHIAEEVTS